MECYNEGRPEIFPPGHQELPPAALHQEKDEAAFLSIQEAGVVATVA